MQLHKDTRQLIWAIMLTAMFGGIIFIMATKNAMTVSFGPAITILTDVYIQIYGYQFPENLEGGKMLSYMCWDFPCKLVSSGS